MKGLSMTVTFCCVKFRITRTKNTCDFEGTCELVAHEHQVAFELYRRTPTSLANNFLYKVYELNLM